MMWRPIDTKPTREDESFFVLIPGNAMCDHLAIQVSIFEGEMYPDALDGCIDWTDRVTNASHWMPISWPSMVTP